MMRPLISKSLLFSTLALLLSFPISAHAYIDPGTGSYIVQVLAAVVLGGLYSMKAYWQQIKAAFGGASPVDEDDEDEDDEDADAASGDADPDSKPTGKSS